MNQTLPEVLVGAVVFAKIMQVRHPEISNDISDMLQLLYASSKEDLKDNLLVETCQNDEKVQLLTKQVQNMARQIEEIKNNPK